MRSTDCCGADNYWIEAIVYPFVKKIYYDVSCINIHDRVNETDYTKYTSNLALPKIRINHNKILKSWYNKNTIYYLINLVYEMFIGELIT